MLPVLDNRHKNNDLPADKQLAPYLSTQEVLLWANHQKKRTHQRTTALIGLVVAGLFTGLLGWIAYTYPDFHWMGLLIFFIMVVGIAFQAGLQLYRYNNVEHALVYGLTATHIWVLRSGESGPKKIPIAQLPKLHLLHTKKGTFDLFYHTENTLPYTSFQKGTAVYLIQDAPSAPTTIELFQKTIRAAQLSPQ